MSQSDFRSWTRTLKLVCFVLAFYSGATGELQQADCTGTAAPAIHTNQGCCVLCCVLCLNATVFVLGVLGLADTSMQCKLEKLGSVFFFVWYP